MRGERIQLSRARGWRMPEGVAKVDRTSPFGNPFRVVRVTKHYAFAIEHEGRELCVLCRDKARAQELAVALYRNWIWQPGQLALRNRIRVEIGDRPVGCWCALDDRCHGDVIRDVAASAVEAEPAQGKLLEMAA